VTMRKLGLEAICIILFAVVPLGQLNVALAQSAAPTNLRVTGVTDWTIGLRWDAPKAKAPASYVVQCTSNGRTMTVPGSQTTATFSSGFDYKRTYSFRVYVVSSSGAWSGASNTVTATLLRDTTPAAKPLVSSTGIGPTHVDLA
jgi:chitodextrinase